MFNEHSNLIMVLSLTFISILKIDAIGIFSIIFLAFYILNYKDKNQQSTDKYPIPENILRKLLEIKYEKNEQNRQIQINKLKSQILSENIVETRSFYDKTRLINFIDTKFKSDVENNDMFDQHNIAYGFTVNC